MRKTDKNNQEICDSVMYSYLQKSILGNNFIYCEQWSIEINAPFKYLQPSTKLYIVNTIKIVIKTLTPKSDTKQVLNIL